VANVCAHTVSVYVEHGASVEAGVKTSESPPVLHVPATAGNSVGRGERPAAGAERVTVKGSAPLVTVRPGRCTTRVGVSGAAEAAETAEPEPGRLPTLWLRATTVPAATAATTTAISSRPPRSPRP
jgi:hypothetical protein